MTQPHYGLNARQNGARNEAQEESRIKRVLGRIFNGGSTINRENKMEVAMMQQANREGLKERREQQKGGMRERRDLKAELREIAKERAMEERRQDHTPQRSQERGRSR